MVNKNLVFLAIMAFLHIFGISQAVAENTSGNVSIVVAQASSEDMLKKIQERADNIKKFRALLNNPDQTTRLSALDVMLKSDDTAMREMAFGICFSSADNAMRSVCLKNKFRDLKTINFKLSEPKNATKKEKNQLVKLGNVYSFNVVSYDEKTGQFSGSYLKGQISGTSMAFEHSRCRGNFVLGDGAELAGKIACIGVANGNYPATLQLQ